MPQFPNYFPQMNNYNSPVQNPYMDRMNFLQGYQQNLQQQMLPTQMSGTSQSINFVGKMVDSVDVVKATDIPMDGNMYYFPKADGTEIFAKQWLPNGTTHILTFKPILNDNTDNLTDNQQKHEIKLSESTTNAFMQRFDSLENRLCEIEQSISKSSSKSKKVTSERESDNND